MAGERVAKRAGVLGMGRKKFVLLFGVLGWGVPTGILFGVLRAYQDGWEQLPVLLAISLAVFPAAGILWGRGMWWWMERKRGRRVGEG